MSDRDLIAIGFTEHDGVLVAPENSRVRLEPAGAAFYRLYVSIGNGNAVTAVLSKSAIKLTREKP
jgi:hypothetical protein